MRILGVPGSLGAKSANRALLETAASLPPVDVEVSIFLGLGDLPHFDPDLESRGYPAVLAWRDAITSSDALLIATPEYGHSLPGVLKNAIDWVIGTGELERKVVGITASVPGPERGRMGLDALRQTLGAVRATIVGGSPITRGPELEASVRDLVGALADAVRASGPR
jgi:chromate reductase, NAD(P)H dehydrogenase (quinone)